MIYKRPTAGRGTQCHHPEKLSMKRKQPESGACNLNQSTCRTSLVDY